MRLGNGLKYERETTIENVFACQGHSQTGKTEIKTSLVALVFLLLP